MNYIGIDPGVSGAIVQLSQDGLPERWLCKFKTPTEIYECVRDTAVVLDDSRFAVEHVHCNPKFGAKGNFKFGMALQAVLCGLVRECWEFVSPHVWQRLLLKSDGENTKQRAKAAASRLWPGHEILKHGGAIDAALIAEWLRRRECGK